MISIFFCVIIYLMKDKIVRISRAKHRKELRRRRNHQQRVMHFHNRASLLPIYENIFSKTKKSIYLNFEGDFCLTTNRDAVINFIAEIDRNIKRYKFTDIIANLVTATSSDLPAITYLSSYMFDNRTNKIHLKVNVPASKNPNAEIWRKCHFDEIVRRNEDEFEGGAFYFKTGKKVTEKDTTDFLNKTKDYFGEDNFKKYSSLPAMWSEIVENTLYHADPKREKGLPWIFNTISEQSKDGSMIREYCVVDLGVGIYDSLRANVNKWKDPNSVGSRLIAAFKTQRTQSALLSENIPLGVGTRHNSEDHGNGLFYIYDQAERNSAYTDFYIVTNKAFVNIKEIDNIGEDSSNNLKGTIYYWRVKI